MAKYKSRWCKFCNVQIEDWTGSLYADHESWCRITIRSVRKNLDL